MDPLERSARAIRDRDARAGPLPLPAPANEDLVRADSYTERGNLRFLLDRPVLVSEDDAPRRPDGALTLPGDCTDERACFEPACSRSDV